MEAGEEVAEEEEPCRQPKGWEAEPLGPRTTMADIRKLQRQPVSDKPSGMMSADQAASKPKHSNQSNQRWIERYLKERHSESGEGRKMTQTEVEGELLAVPRIEAVKR